MMNQKFTEFYIEEITNMIIDDTNVFTGGIADGEVVSTSKTGFSEKYFSGDEKFYHKTIIEVIKKYIMKSGLANIVDIIKRKSKDLNNRFEYIEAAINLIIHIEAETPYFEILKEILYKLDLKDVYFVIPYSEYEKEYIERCKTIECQCPFCIGRPHLIAGEKCPNKDKGCKWVVPKAMIDASCALNYLVDNGYTSLIYKNIARELKIDNKNSLLNTRFPFDLENEYRKMLDSKETRLALSIIREKQKLGTLEDLDVINLDIPRKYKDYRRNYILPDGRIIPAQKPGEPFPKELQELIETAPFGQCSVIIEDQCIEETWTDAIFYEELKNLRSFQNLLFVLESDNIKEKITDKIKIERMKNFHNR